MLGFLVWEIDLEVGLILVEGKFVLEFLGRVGIFFKVLLAFVCVLWDRGY